MTSETWKKNSEQNVFEMIAGHGGPGLWLRRTTWGNTCARVVAIGKITKPAPYFGNPSLLIDVYSLDGNLREGLVPLPAGGTYKTWRRWPEPEWANDENLRSLEDPQIVAALHALDKKRHKLPHPQRSAAKNLAGAPSVERVFLAVSYDRKDEAKKIGAKWAAEVKQWWLPAEGKDAIKKARELGFLHE